MTEWLLDSNIVILALRSTPIALDLLARAAQTDRVLFVSVATRTEVCAGMHPHEEADTIELLDTLRSLPVTTAIADRAGRWIYQYARRGFQLSFPDALIAATAAIHDLTLITTNQKHFPMLVNRVKGLRDLAE